MSDVMTFATGASRSADIKHLRFSQIHPLALIALARVAAEGGEKYGDKQWEKGMPIEDSIDHALGHLTMFMAGDRSEPHLEHLLYNVLFMIHAYTFHPELCESLRGPGCTLTKEILEHLDETEAERQEARADGEHDLLGDWNLFDVPEVQRILQQRRDHEHSLEKVSARINELMEEHAAELRAPAEPPDVCYTGI